MGAILIADDEHLIRFALRDALEKAGYRCIVAENGTMAVELARRDRPDVMILDIDMPGMDGFEVCRTLRQDPAMVDVPVLFHTGVCDSDHMTRGYELGAELFLEKPVDAQVLVAKVRALTERAGQSSTVVPARPATPAPPPRTPELPPGTTIAGRYRIVRTLGQGAMCHVYRVADLSLGGDCALKLLRPSYDPAEHAAERFAREVDVLRHLRHAGLIRVLDAGVAPEGPWYTMEVLPGMSLKERMAAGPFTPEEALRLVSRLTDAVAHVHAHGVLHRDIKPGNVMFDAAGLPVLTDLGLALVLDDADRLTHQDRVVGTPAYMAPEQVRNESLDARCDVYALGVLLYELVSGRLPFLGATARDTMRLVAAAEPARPLRQLDPAIPPEVEALCADALAKDPARRPASATALLERIEDAILAIQAPSRPMTVSDRPIRLLVIEDERGGASPIARILERTRSFLVKIQTTSRLADAHDRLARGQVDLVLLDLGLLGERGEVGCRELRDRFPEIPMVVLTGHADEELGLRLIGVGIQDYLVRDRISLQQLEHSLRFALQRHRLQEHERTRAVCDDLTGLYNRGGFLVAAARRLENARSARQSGVLVFADMDGLKQLNDTRGHAAGDRALLDVAALLRRVFRGEDVVSRLGGDEFAALVTARKVSASELIDRLRDELARFNALGHREHELALSLGAVTTEPGDSRTLSELVAKADELMYREKSLKRDPVSGRTRTTVRRRVVPDAPAKEV